MLRPECISSNAAATGESMAILVDSGAPGFSATQRVSAVPSTRSITTYRAELDGGRSPCRCIHGPSKTSSTRARPGWFKRISRFP